MDKKAEELIGLSYDQFRQVIILPQGKFEKLLTSDSKDKEAILVSIFDAGKWQKIADKYFEKAKAKKDELNAIKVKVENSLKEDGCSDLAELKKKADKLEAEMKAEEDAFNKADYSNRKKALTDQKALAEKFLPPRYIALAPADTAAFKQSIFPAGDNNSTLLFNILFR